MTTNCQCGVDRVPTTNVVRLVSGRRSSAEALIEADSTRRFIDIVMRGRAGSNEECAKLLHELTEELLFKASLSRIAADHVLPQQRRAERALSPDLPTRPVTAYLADEVFQALYHRQTVTDGRAI